MNRHPLAKSHCSSCLKSLPVWSCPPTPMLACRRWAALLQTPENLVSHTLRGLKEHISAWYSNNFTCSRFCAYIKTIKAYSCFLKVLSTIVELQQKWIIYISITLECPFTNISFPHVSDCSVGGGLGWSWESLVQHPMWLKVLVGRGSAPSWCPWARDSTNAHIEPYDELWPHPGVYPSFTHGPQRDKVVCLPLFLILFPTCFKGVTEYASVSGLFLCDYIE